VILRTTKNKVTKETTVAAPLSVLPSGLPAYPDPPVALAGLHAFRAALHACCPRRADALVDLADALLSTQGPVASLPRLSLEPAHRRGWGSLYAALACRRIDAERLRDLLAGCLLPADPLVFAVDVTTWPRCDAECSPERGLYYHPSRHSAGQPIVAGWAFQWIAQLGFVRDSWTAPVDARRLHPTDDTDHTAAVQVRALLARLPAGGPIPWFVFDAGYDSAQLSLELADAGVAVLVRLRSDRCFYADPPPRPPGAGGRPRRHVRLRRPGHLAGPDHHARGHRRPVRHGDGAGLGGAASQAAPPPRPRFWQAAADRARHHPARPGRAHPGQDPPAEGAVAVVGRPRGLPAGSGACLAGLCPQVRLRAHHPLLQADPRLDHPRPRHPEQAERWTWLVLAGYTQLRLARQLVADQRLAWERPRPPGQLSPYRVRRGFPRLLAALGSPAAAPKPSGRSPGRPKGHRSGPALRHPAVKKPTKKPRKKRPTTTKAA
jgi:hypothetical protein